MSVLRSMRNELFRYRKRKNASLDGSIPGVPYNSFARSRRHVSGMPHRPGFPGYHHDPYMPDNPGGYRPGLNAPAIQAEEYLENGDWESHMISHPTSSKLFRPFPELPVAEEILTHGKSESASQFFLRVMEVMYQPFEEGQEIPSLADIWLEYRSTYNDDVANIEQLFETTESTPETVTGRFREISDALNRLQCVLPEDHPDIINLKRAQIQLGRQHLSEMEKDPKFWEIYNSIDDNWQSKLGEGNPYENDDILQQNIPALPDEMEQIAMPVEENMLPENDHINEYGLEQAVESEAVLEPQSQFTQDDMMQMMEIANPEMAEPMEQGFEISPVEVFDEINQAIDQVVEQPVQEEPEPDPFRMQYDPFMEQQYMFDPQYMPDYMAGGPMGPMPGL